MLYGYEYFASLVIQKSDTFENSPQIYYVKHTSYVLLKMLFMSL